jgi:hypothetical protein
MAVGAGSLRENGRRTDLAFFGRAVGALVHGCVAPVKAVPFRRVAVAGKTIAGHRVGRGTLRGDVNQAPNGASVQAKTHSEPAMSQLKQVARRLGGGKPIRDPGNVRREAIKLSWAWLVDDHQRQPPCDCHREDRIVIIQRGGRRRWRR